MINPDLVLDVPQGSEEWFDARVGKISASNFSKLITSTGKKSTQYTTYQHSLIAEIMMGHKIETHQSEAMKRGTEMEAEARAYYELVTGHDVEEIGLIYKDDTRRVSCSPDGLLSGCPRGLEIKCPLEKTQIKYLLAGKLPSEYVAQVQGSMYVTGLDSWDFLSYHPELPPLLLTVEKDPDFHTALDSIINEFITKMDANLKKLGN